MPFYWKLKKYSLEEKHTRKDILTRLWQDFGDPLFPFSVLQREFSIERGNNLDILSYYFISTFIWLKVIAFEFKLMQSLISVTTYNNTFWNGCLSTVLLPEQMGMQVSFCPLSCSLVWNFRAGSFLATSWTHPCVKVKWTPCQCNSDHSTPLQRSTNSWKNRWVILYWLKSSLNKTEI